MATFNILKHSRIVSRIVLVVPGSSSLAQNVGSVSCVCLEYTWVFIYVFIMYSVGAEGGGPLAAIFPPPRQSHRLPPLMVPAALIIYLTHHILSI